MPSSVSQAQVLKFQSKPGSLQCPSLVHMTTALVAMQWARKGSPFSFHKQLRQGTLPELNTMENCPQIGTTQRWSQLNTVWEQFLQIFFHAYISCRWVQKNDFMFLTAVFCSQKISNILRWNLPHFLLTSITHWYLNWINPIKWDSKNTILSQSY